MRNQFVDSQEPCYDVWLTLRKLYHIFCPYIKKSDFISNPLKIMSSSRGLVNGRAQQWWYSILLERDIVTVLYAIPTLRWRFQFSMICEGPLMMFLFLYFVFFLFFVAIKWQRLISSTWFLVVGFYNCGNHVTGWTQFGFFSIQSTPIRINDQSGSYCYKSRELSHAIFDRMNRKAYSLPLSMKTNQKFEIKRHRYLDVKFKLLTGC